MTHPDGARGIVDVSFVLERGSFTVVTGRIGAGKTTLLRALLGWPDDPAVLDRAIQAAVLEPDLAALERGLDTLVGPRGVRLSGGQVQRAAATRMFVRAAELLASSAEMQRLWRDERGSLKAPVQ